MLGRFISRHGLALNEWDSYKEEDGFIILGWADEDLQLAVEAVLTEKNYTAGVDRLTRFSVGRRATQSVRVTNDYRHQCQDFRAAIAEIRQHRKKKAPTKART